MNCSPILYAEISPAEVIASIKFDAFIRARVKSTVLTKHQNLWLAKSQEVIP